MKPWMLLIVCCCLLGGARGAAGESIRFNIGPEGYPPYMINEADSPPRGIMVEVLQTIAAKHGHTVNIAGIPRKRVDIRMQNGTLDATPRAKEWVSDPEAYAFTDAVVRARDVLFSRREEPLTFDTIDDLIGKTLGTHLGYRYPLLEPYFDTQQIRRRDADDELAMLRMVLGKRTDAAVINELVGAWLIQQNDWQDKFAVATQEIQGFDYRIMFRKEWHAFVQQFNQELQRMRDDGTLEHIIAAYALPKR